MARSCPPLQVQGCATIGVCLPVAGILLDRLGGAGDVAVALLALADGSHPLEPGLEVAGLKRRDDAPVVLLDRLLVYIDASLMADSHGLGCFLFLDDAAASEAGAAGDEHTEFVVGGVVGHDPHRRLTRLVIDARLVEHRHQPGQLGLMR
jgi:hypothetical protein